MTTRRIDPAIRQQLLDLAGRCPVHRALTREVEVRTHAGA